MICAVLLDFVAMHIAQDATGEGKKHPARKDFYLNVSLSRLERETDRSRQFPKY
jgi:hypothetical protein